MNYQETVEYLVNLDVFGWHPGLARIEKLMEVLGNPEKEMRFVHIGGTNGKGSTTSMLVSALRANGYKTGMFISPHLVSYRERMQINGEMVPKERLVELTEKVKGKIKVMTDQGYEHPTGFEVSTAIALLYFYEEKTDIAVIEVGLGGAIDSTNVIIPAVSVITNVTLDHMFYLGDTVREIATVKSGIIKEGVPVITASEDPEALDVIRTKAKAMHAPYLRIGRELYYNVLELREDGTRFLVKDDQGYSIELQTPLVGVHQAVNGSTVMMVIKELEKQGMVFSAEKTMEGFQKTFWPARLELVGTKPKILLDAAHNFDGAVKLRRSLNSIYKYDKLIYVIGMLADKQRSKVLAKLGPLADSIVVTKPNSPRAGDWEAMYKEARNYTHDVYKDESIEGAVDKALSLAGEDDLVCIAGSIYMVAYAREYILKLMKNSL
jgi:dihydrofolate synthase/folylpolyglutamate synthase